MDFRTMLKKKKYAKHAADDQGPDWGDLKHVEREDGEGEPSPDKVSIKRGHTLHKKTASNLESSFQKLAQLKKTTLISQDEQLFSLK